MASMLCTRIHAIEPTGRTWVPSWNSSAVVTNCVANLLTVLCRIAAQQLGRVSACGVSCGHAATLLSAYRFVWSARCHRLIDRRPRAVRREAAAGAPPGAAAVCDREHAGAAARAGRHRRSNHQEEDSEALMPPRVQKMFGRRDAHPNACRISSVRGRRTACEVRLEEARR